MKSTSPHPDAAAVRRGENSGPISGWPREERPREKLRARGLQAMSHAELLALLLRTGAGGRTALDMARELLTHYRSLRLLSACRAVELERVPGIGPAKAVGLVAAFELGRRVQAESPAERDVISSPADVARRMVPRLGTCPTEVFMVLLLDARNAVTSEIELSRGTLTASIVHPREVFKEAVDARAAAVIVVHNHPSGNVEPSAEDIAITRQLADAGRVLGIPLHDHLIVAGNTFTSLAERGLLER